MAQYAVPVADVVTTGWTRTAGTYSSNIDDGPTPNDSDLVQAPSTNSPNSSAALTVNLGTVTDPGAGVTSGYVLRVRAKKTTAGTVQCAFALQTQAGVTISGITNGPVVTTSFVDYTITLTPTQITAVRTAGFNNLRLFLQSLVSSGTAQILQVSNGHLEVPDANFNYNQSGTASLSLTGSVARGIGTNRIAALSLTGSQASRGIGKPLASALTLIGSQGSKAVGKPQTVSLSLTGSVGRQVAAKRSFATGLSLSAVVARSVVMVRAISASLSLTGTKSTQTARGRNYTTSLSLAAVVAKGLAARRALTASMSLTASQATKDVGVHRAAALSLTGIAAKSFAITKNLAASLSLTATATRSVAAAKAFNTALALAASGRLDMALSVFNRVSTGGSAVIKKLFFISDD